MPISKQINEKVVKREIAFLIVFISILAKVASKFILFASVVLVWIMLFSLLIIKYSKLFKKIQTLFTQQDQLTLINFIILIIKILLNSFDSLYVILRKNLITKCPYAETYSNFSVNLFYFSYINWRKDEITWFIF